MSVLCVCLTAACVHGHPVTFKDGSAFTMRSMPNNVSAEYNYTFHPQWAVTTSLLNRQIETEELKMGSIGLNSLVKRWNYKHSQANIYLLSTVSLRIEASPDDPVFGGGLQLDYETTTFYTAIRGNMHYVDGAQWSDLTYRVGIAPYEAGYKSLQSWLIGQVMYMRAPNGYMLRPMGLLRFFYRTVLWEIGADSAGLPWLQLMVHF